jgi:hypothetical protein
MGNEEAEKLLHKYREGQATEEESERLLDWVQQYQETDELQLSPEEIDMLGKEKAIGILAKNCRCGFDPALPFCRKLFHTQKTGCP